MTDKTSNTIPAEAIGAISGLYFKIGVHGRAFYWCEGEWLKSCKTGDEVVEELSKMAWPMSLTADHHKKDEEGAA